MSTADLARGSSYHTRHSSQEQDLIVTLPKKLIVCCDGTWMDSDNGFVEGKWGKPGHMQNPTNVTRIARAIKSEDDAHTPQIVYYQAGVGTGIGLWSRLVGGGAGVGLAEHIREAYGFLVNNYREYDPEAPGLDADSIFLIGFSRGAFTARSIGGLIGAVGLLKKKAMQHFYQIFQDWENAGNHNYKPQFFDSYYELHPGTSNSKPDLALARDRKNIDKYMDAYFKRLLALDLTQQVTVNCIGVFDTVGSLGIPVNPIIQKILPFMPAYLKEFKWFDTRIDVHVNNAFQALALDEHRYPFSPTLWEKPPNVHTNVKQVWFPGAHSNVGGSYSDHGIADITLAWMMDQLAGNTTKHPEGFKPREWIKFDEQYIYSYMNAELPASETAKMPAYRGWAKGYLYENNYFPLSLLGKRVRGPGCYHRMDSMTNKATDKMLENTNEYIHSSVRARIDMGGRGVENDPAMLFPNGINFFPFILPWIKRRLGRPPPTYQPMAPDQPLHGWKLKDGHKSHHPPNFEIEMNPEGLAEITWEYQGSGQSSCRVMREDRMGPFELKLLQKDKHLAELIMYSNNEWRWRKWQPDNLPKKGHTL